MTRGKQHAILYFSLLWFSLQLAIPAETPSKSEIPKDSALVLGGVKLAAELVESPKKIEARSFVKISKAATYHPINEPDLSTENSAFVLRRYKTEIMFENLGFGKQIPTLRLERTWEENRRIAVQFSKLYRRQAVIEYDPFVSGNLITFVGKEGENGLAQFEDLISISDIDFESLKKALLWRLQNDQLFDSSKRVGNLALLREQLFGRDAMTRQAAFFYLTKINKITRRDVRDSFAQASNYIEVGSMMLILLRYSRGDISYVSDMFDIDNHMAIFNGLALGAGVDFLSLGERISDEAAAYRVIVRNAPKVTDKSTVYAVPKALEQTRSYPLLLKLSRTVRNRDNKLKIPVASLLEGMLFYCNADFYVEENR